MRARGAVVSARGCAADDHVCWTYASDAAFRDVACAWLDDGRALGMRLVLTADAPVERLITDLAGLSGRDALLGSGQLMVAPLRTLYDLDAPIDCAAQVALYQGVVAGARADGYAGVRVVSDGTPLAQDPARRASLARWELVADRWIAGGVPLSCLCTLDTRKLPVGAVDDVLRVHPCHHHAGGEPPFRLHGSHEAVGVSGEVDRFGARAFADALALAPLEGGEVDLSGLTFADHHALLELGRAVQRAGVPVRLRGASSPVRRLWTLLDLPGEPQVRWT